MRLLSLAAVLLATLFAAPLSAQPYPNRPIRVIVPFAAGSATDTVARVFMNHVSQRLGQPVVIDNRPGANGLLGAEAAAKSPNDGYTLLVGTNSTNAAAPALFRTVPFQESDFQPISFLSSVPLIVAVTNSFPATTLRELLDRARAEPESVLYAAASSSQRVSSAMLASMAGVRMSYVPYRAGPQAMTDLVGGRVHMYTADLAVMLPQVRGGNVRALAVTSRQRSPSIPELPTVEEAAGLQGYELIAWFGLFAPAGTPRDVVDRLNAAIREAAQTAEVRDRLVDNLGMVVAPSTPEELAARVREEAAKWARAVADAGIERE